MLKSRHTLGYVMCLLRDTWRGRCWSRSLTLGLRARERKRERERKRLKKRERQEQKGIERERHYNRT